MQSKNKPGMRKAEREHVERIKALSCGVCGAHGPSEAHELKQGHWYTSIPLCADCHRGSFNGIHGQQRIWRAMKLDEAEVLNQTIERLFYDSRPRQSPDSGASSARVPIARLPLQLKGRNAAA